MPATNFKFSDQGFTNIDFDDVFVRREFFLEGGLWSWGANGNGNLGNNTTVSTISPIQTISGGTNWKQVSAGLATTAGIKTDGTLWLWGQNTNFGFLGNNATVNRSSPVQTVSAGTNWKQVSISGFHVGAIKTDGTLWLWGGGGGGRLGNNSTINRSSPVQTVSAGTNWKQVSIGYTSAAVKTDGTLWTWGSDAVGRLGDNNSINRSSPVQTVSSGTNWKQVSVGCSFTAAIKTDGTLWLWGSGFAGVFGNNTTIDRSSPVQTISSGNNWKEVSVGFVNTSAIKTDGTLWTWGSSTAGRLGNNETSIDRSSPVQTVSSGTNWKKVSVGYFHTSAIKTDGTLWSWGCNTVYGRLGDNSNINKSSPVQTVSAGTDWRQVDAGVCNNTSAIREQCW
jgi:alpha-tubulin suppressor-like RCC1 family protein